LGEKIGQIFGSNVKIGQNFGLKVKIGQEYNFLVSGQHFSVLWGQN